MKKSNYQQLLGLDITPPSTINKAMANVEYVQTNYSMEVFDENKYGYIHRTAVFKSKNNTIKPEMIEIVYIPVDNMEDNSYILQYVDRKGESYTTISSMKATEIDRRLKESMLDRSINSVLFLLFKYSSIDDSNLKEITECIF